MKITPLEIRQKAFEKKLRGYDKDEVNAFLLSLSQEWERIMDLNKELKIKLDASEKEVEKLREVESSLFKTLKTAEDTGANMIQQANKTAELHLRETQMNADGLLNESKSKAKAIIEEANTKSKETLEKAEERLKELMEVYKSIENQKDNLVSEIQNLANDSLNKTNRILAKSNKPDFEEIIEKIKEQPADDEANVSNVASVKMNQVAPNIKEPENMEPTGTKKNEVVTEKSSQEPPVTKSFFDEIE